MFELFIQESYMEWLVPLTFVIMWMLTLRIISLGYSIGIQEHFQNVGKDDLTLINLGSEDSAPRLCHQLVKTIKRKICPDDPEGRCTSSI